MLKTFKSIVWGALMGALIGSAAVGPASAQLIINQTPMPVREPSPRQFSPQTTHYIRTTFNYGMCGTVASTTCTFKLANAALPYNSVVVRIYYAIYTAFNSTTSDTLSLGTNTTAVNLVAATSIHAVLTGANMLVTLAATDVPTLTGGATTPTGLQGGFDVWAIWTAGTGNTATAGSMSIIIEYFAPNDGMCTPYSVDSVPVATTNPGC